MEDDTRSESPPTTDSGAEIPLNVIPLHSTNLLTVLDDTGVILYESPSIERIFGFEQDELIGEQVADYFHPDDRQRVVEAYRAVVASEEYTVETVEYRHERADGSYLWVESVASANPTPEGYYVINTRDVSDRRAREQELQDSIARLDDFANVISHDLRNPLSVATGRLELAREASDSEHLDEVSRALDRMETLIDDLLTLAQTGKPVQEVDSVELSTIVEACWQTVATREAYLVLDADRTIKADESRLRQLFENLFRNAVEHGGEDVTVRVGALDGGFYVEDDGSGIAEADRERVFDSGYSTSDEGTGFGLAIVSEIAEAHGWEITVSSGPDGGTRFEFTGVQPA